jgi:hypothetical protein
MFMGGFSACMVARGSTPEAAGYAVLGGPLLKDMFPMAYYFVVLFVVFPGTCYICYILTQYVGFFAFFGFFGFFGFLGPGALGL